MPTYHSSSRHHALRSRRRLPRRAELLGLVFTYLGLAGGRSAAAQTPTAAAGDRPAAAAAVAGIADTVTLTVRDAQRLALQQNPAFLAVRQDTAVARGGVRQARVYQYNPDLTLIVPGTGLGQAQNPVELAVTQEIEFAGQRGLRIGAAEYGFQRAGGTVRNAARLTSADASTAFYRALAAERRVGVAGQVLALNERLLQAVRAQIREGEISTLDANLAEIELGRARGRVLAAQRAATSAGLELRRLTGIEPDVPVRLAEIDGAGEPTPAALDRDSLFVLALSRRGDLAADSASIREFETLRALARRQNVPNLRVGAVLEWAQVGGGTAIGPAVGLTLPLFNRNQGVADQRAAQAEQARLTLQATVLRVRTEITDAVRAYQTATEEARVFETSVLEPARQNTTLLETAYRSGKLPLPSLLLLRNQLLDAELGFWDAWLARREALVRLDAATGATGAGEAP